ncbi:MAG: hypothetical protein ACE5EX_06660, partial [Phycisphaerae bacterium]
ADSQDMPAPAAWACHPEWDAPPQTPRPLAWLRSVRTPFTIALSQHRSPTGCWIRVVALAVWSRSHAMVITLLYTLSGGMLSVLATGRTDQISWRFLRLVGMIVLIVMTGATAWTMSRDNPSPETTWPATVWLGGAVALGAMLVVFLAPWADRAAALFRTVCGVAGLSGLAAAALSAVGAMGPAVHTTAPLASPPDTLAAVLVAAAQVLGGLLLGAITVSWLLGHAYLTATKMTLAPMRHFTRLLSWSVAIRCGFLVCSLLIAWIAGGEREGSVLLHLKQAWLIVILRVGVGLIGVGVFAYMVADCVRLRSTQSATGILYFGSLFAYIGEMASRQLVAECGWPL